MIHAVIVLKSATAFRASFRPQSPHVPPTAKMFETRMPRIPNQVAIANDIIASHAA